MESFLPGETVRVDVAFTDLAGAALAVTGVVVKLQTPAAETTVDPGQVLANGVGKYYVNLLMSLVGRHRLRVTCTGPSSAAIEKSWNVSKSNFA